MRIIYAKQSENLPIFSGEVFAGFTIRAHCRKGEYFDERGFGAVTCTLNKNVVVYFSNLKLRAERIRGAKRCLFYPQSFLAWCRA